MLKELNELLSQKNKKILFVGIGNILKQDDGVGVYIAQRIMNFINIQSLIVETSIENYIGKINSLNPDILVLIDCVDFHAPFGTIKLLKVNQIQDLTFNTHNISFRRLSEFFNMKIFILGIQPEKIGFGENLSYLVKGVADKLIKQINKMEVYHGSRIFM